MLRILPLLLIFIALNIQAEQDFKPHMIDHTFPGCPANSDCSMETGATHSKWLNLLKQVNKFSDKKKINRLEKHRKQYGIPLSFWVASKKKPDPQIIIWDSHCKQHSAEDKQKILLGLSHSKNFKELAKFEGSLIKKAYLAKDDKVLSFMVPREDAPLSIRGDELYYTREDEGFYYGLLVQSNGDLKLAPVSFPKNSPIEVRCPEELVNRFKKDNPLPNLYSGYFCKSLWNDQSKRRQTLIIGWSCN